MHIMPCALVLALLSEGSSIAARIAIMAMTTSSSIKVNPSRQRLDRGLNEITFIAVTRLIYLNLVRDQAVNANLVPPKSARKQNVHAIKIQLTRRAFLKTTSTATLAAPLILSSARSAPGPKGPNDQITLGFIGTGTQGRGLL